MPAASDPRDAIIQKLGEPVIDRPISAARTETIDFLKQRTGAQVMLFAVSYTDIDDREHIDILGARRQSDGWVADGGTRGSGPSPHKDHPWLNYAGWWNKYMLCVGGEVAGDRSDQVRRVRLTFVDQTTVEDDADRGVTLFIVEHGVQLPGVADLFDDAGTVVSSHEVFKPLAGLKPR